MTDDCSTLFSNNARKTVGYLSPAATLNRAHVRQTGGRELASITTHDGDTVAAAVGGNASWELQSLAQRAGASMKMPAVRPAWPWRRDSC